MRFVRIGSFRILVLGVALYGITTAPASARSNFAQTKLEAFVTAAMVVDELVQKWTPRIRSAGKGEEGAKLRAEAEAEMHAAIERTDGITVAEYNEIGAAARKDQALMAQLIQIFKTSLKAPQRSTPQPHADAQCGKEGENR